MKGKDISHLFKLILIFRVRGVLLRTHFKKQTTNNINYEYNYREQRRVQGQGLFR